MKKLLEKKINIKKYKVTIFYDNFLLKNKFPIYESLGSNKLFKDIELRIVNSKNSDLLFQIKTQILNLNHILRFITSRLKTFYLKKLLKIKNKFLKNKFKILLLNYDYNLLFFLSNKNYNISLYEDIKIKGNGDEFLEHSLKIIKNKKSQNNKILCSIKNIY